MNIFYLLFIVSLFMFIFIAYYDKKNNIKCEPCNCENKSKYKITKKYEKFILNDKIKNEISSLSSSCKNVNINTSKFLTYEEYVKEMNKLSCECKGIGFWGGFCLDKRNVYVGGNHAHDMNLAAEIASICYNKSVIDLGAGLGWYCPYISKMSTKCDQYDGSVNIEEVTKDSVKYLNLAEPIQFECNYDIVVSLEVAEHIPAEYEEVYVNNLLKCCKEGLVITWSRVGQPGHFHVNNKNREDVIKLFENKGMKYEPDITIKLKNRAQFEWLKNNILYFSRH